MGEDENGRKRKLNVFDFLKGSTETLPTTTPYAPIIAETHPVKRTRREEPHQDTIESSPSDNERSSSGETVNHIGFTMDTPMSFTKASDMTTSAGAIDEVPPEVPEYTESKLSYSEIDSLNNKSTTRTGFNLFKGKKYGLGAALLESMGWVPGKGLGVRLQGITEPIDQGVHRQGVGIGADMEKKSARERRKKSGKVEKDDLSEVESSEDEEYYKEVPKKSLFQIITEIESMGFSVPLQIKELSNQYSAKAKKSFIELRKEGGNEGLEEVTSKLDKLNNELSNLVASIKMAEFEHQQLQSGFSRIQERAELYASLQTRLQAIEAFNQQGQDDPLASIELIRYDIERHAELYASFATKLQEVDIQNLLLLSIKPLLSPIFANWNPLDIHNTTLPTQLKLWKETAPPFTQHYGELDPFQSLIYTLWHPKMIEAFSTVPIEHVNLGLTVLLEWESVLDETIISHFLQSVITPKIIDQIHGSDPLRSTTSYDWVEKWLIYLPDADEVKRDISIQLDAVLGEWDTHMGKIGNLDAYKAIVGGERFEKTIMERLLPRLITLLINTDYRFDGDINEEVLKCITCWSDIWPEVVLDRVLTYGLFNSWLRSLYHALSQCMKKKSGFRKVASSLRKWCTILRLFPITSGIVDDQLYRGLDMVNTLVDTQVLSPVHESLTKTQILDQITVTSSTPASETKPQGIPVHKLQVSFKEVVEEYCTRNNLFLAPVRGNFSTGKSLFKISRDLAGKQALVAYIEEDVLFIAADGDAYEPISLDDLAERV